MRQIRKGLKTVFLAGLLTGLLTGCGGEYMGMEGTVSGRDVSGAAVSGQTVEADGELMKQDTFPNFCTDTNWYRERWLESGIIQSRLDGSDAKVILEDRASWIISVVDSYVYYVNYDGKMNRESVCRVPVQKDRDGFDKVLEDEEQILITVKTEDTDDEGQTGGICGIYVNPKFILYGTCESDKNQCMMYDLETGETTKAGLLSMDLEGDAEMVGCGDYVLARSFLEGVFVWKPGETDWKKISDYDAVCEDSAWNGQYYFFCDDEKRQDNGIPNCIYRYALKNGTREQIVSPGQLSEAAQKAQGLPDADMIDLCAVTDLFCQGGRLYVQVQLNWKEGKEYHMAYQMFSLDQEETLLCYEKELTECMREHGKWRNGRWETKHPVVAGDREFEYSVTEDVVCNGASCYDIIDGKAYMMYCDDYYSERTWVDRIGCYDLETGEFRWLTQKDPEYFKPAYQFGSAEEYFCSEKSYKHVHIGNPSIMEWGPEVGPEAGEDWSRRASQMSCFRETSLTN